jgi:hypothetical protein
MSFVSVSLLWPGDPEPGRSALDEKRGTSSKPADDEPARRYGARRTAPPITLPRSAGEFSRLRESRDARLEFA